MHASNPAAALARVLRRARPGVLIALTVLLCGCPEEQAPVAADAEPTLIFGMQPALLFMAAGDRARVRLSATDLGGITSYIAGVAGALGTGAATAPNDTTITIDRDPNDPAFFPSDAAALVETGAATEPGVYQIPLELSVSVGGVSYERERVLTLVVLASDAAPLAGAVVGVSAGDFHSLALLDDGSVWAWGRNHRGQLGDGSLIDRAVPVPVSGLPGPAIEVAAGAAHSLALLEDGSVFGWGDNEQGQVLRPNLPGGTTPLPNPTRILISAAEPLRDIIDIAAGSEHSVSLNRAGRVLVWGTNQHGEIGDRAYTDAAKIGYADLPVVATAVAAGDGFSLALADDASVWAWGRSESGQLGGAVGRPYQESPVDVGFVPDVLGIGVGTRHTLLILDDGNVGGLGRNDSAQLGDGSLQSPLAQPAVPPFLRDVVEVDGGWLHSLARQSDRSVHAWGSNDFGQASDAGNAQPDALGRRLQLVPVRVTGVPPSAAIATGGRHSLSLDDRCGQIWSWGDNGYAQLGDGGVLAPGGSSPDPMPVYGLGELALPAGCPVLLSVVTRGPGRLSASGSDIDDDACVEPCTARFTVGSQLTLSAAAEPDAVFLGWSGACAGAAPVVQLTLSRSRSCLARFNRLPIADFTIDPNPARVSFDLVDFDASTSSDDGRIVRFEWDLDGDGRFELEGDRVSRFFDAIGDYSVSLRVSDDDGAASVAVQTLSVGVLANASFVFESAAPVAGQAVRFDAAQSTGAGGITGYEWDFESDGVADANGVEVTHTFPVPGTYRVRLRVTAAATLDGIRVRDVVVGAAPGGGGDAVLSVVNAGEGAGVVESAGGLLECSFAAAVSVPDPCAQALAAGSQVRLSATPNDGSFFSHWGVGDCDSELPTAAGVDCQVTVEAARSVRVYFE